MNREVLDPMQARARAIKTRAAVRAWEYRQRHHAAGVWFRLRRLLADAQEAYEIGEADADRLVAEGYQPAPCGGDVEPPKRIIVVDKSRLSRIEHQRPIPVGLGAEFMAARALALVPFAEDVAARDAAD